MWLLFQKKKRNQLELVLTNWTLLEYKRLAKYTYLTIENKEDIFKYMGNSDCSKNIIEGIKRVKTTIKKVLLDKQPNMESKFSEAFFRKEILELLEKTSNIKTLLNNLNENEINNFGKIIKYIGNVDIDFKSLDTKGKYNFIIDAYALF